MNTCTPDQNLLWLVVALALAIPAGVWFGIQIGRMREQADRRRRHREQFERFAVVSRKQPPSVPGLHSTRELLSWMNGQGRSDTSIDKEEG